MSSTKAGFRERLKERVRNRSQEKSQKSVSRPASTMSPDHLLVENASQIPLVTTLSQDCQDTPIRELWNVAYEKLREEDAKLVEEYESSLQKNLPQEWVNVTSLKTNRREWMDSLLKHKMQETQASIWKLTFGSSEIQLTGTIRRVLRVLKSMNECVTAAVSSNSSASLAWTGVGMLLPLFLNPIEQASNLADGLEYISSLIVQSRMREDLYHRRYELNGSSETPSRSKAIFKNTLEELYRHILKFEVTSYCYYTHNEASRFSRDFFKRDDWSKIIGKIRSLDSHFFQINQIWRDSQYHDELMAAQQRHQESINSLTVVGAEVSSLKEAVEDATSKKEHRNLMRWLTQVDSSPIYNSALNRHEAGTSEWLLRHNEKFTNWMKGSSSFIWLHGKAGSGKSILSTSVIKHLKEKYDHDASVAVAYFYFSFNDLQRQDRDGMLRSIIKQICCQRPNMPESIEKLKDYKRQDAQPPTDLLEQSLLDVMCGFSATYVIIDALDECPKLKGERAELMKSLSRILTATMATTASNLHLFCTSRKEVDINIGFSGHLSRSEAAEIDLSSCKQEVEQDISRYIDSTLSSADFNSWSQTIRTKVKEELVKKSDRMFQYVRCQFDNLQRFKSPAEIQRALKELPEGLDETYERILRNIDPIYQTRVASCLQWLASSYSILTIYDLAEVFVLRPTNDTIIDEDERIFNSEDLLTWLHGLVIVDGGIPVGPETKYVRLSHYSIKEYLTSNRMCEDLAPVFAFSDNSAHLWIARSSLAYVLHMAVTCRVTEDAEKFSTPINSDHHGTLRWYTARYWPKHLEKVPHDTWPADLVEMAKSALSAQSQSLIITLLGYNVRLDISEILQHPYRFTVRAGYSQLTKLILSNGLSTNKYLTQKEINTMLMAAVWAGSKELVSALLGRGAGISGEGNGSHLPCRLAAHTGRSGIRNILFKSCADIHARCGPALEGAAEQEGQQGLRMLKRFITRSTYIDDVSSAAECVLPSAARRRNNTKQLELLLAKGADINMRSAGDNAETALYAAASRGHWDNFDLLLQRGADINIGGRYGFPLHGLVRSGRDVDGALVRMRRLIELGADPKAKCEELGTALHVACSNARLKAGSIQIAQFLVDSGVDINAVGGPHAYGTPLQACADARNIRLAEWLLTNKADVNLQGGEYGNALQVACDHGHLEMVQLLLAHGADVNAHGGKYGSALQAACRSRSTDIVRLLLQRGAHVNKRGGKFGTALQAAAWTYWGDGYEDKDGIEIVRLLLEHGANVHIQGGKYGNALNAAAAAVTHNLALLKILLEHGTDVNQVCGEFGTALHSVLAIGEEPWPWPWDDSLNDLCIGKIRFLLDNGADISLSAGKHGLLLHSACALGSSHGFLLTMADHLKKMDTVTSTIKLLFDRKPSIDANAHSGVFGTALQAAAYSGLAEPTRLLLDRGARVACHEWCGKYGSALNAAVIRGHWDIVYLLREAGAKPDCFSMQKPDEEWLQKIRQEEGSEAEERYRIFWESEKPIQDQTPFSRLSLLIVAYLSLLLLPFQLFISFQRTELIRPKKKQ